MNEQDLIRQIEAYERIRDAASDMLTALKSLVVNDGRISGVSLGALEPMVQRSIAKAEGSLGPKDYVDLPDGTRINSSTPRRKP